MRKTGQVRAITHRGLLCVCVCVFNSQLAYNKIQFRAVRGISIHRDVILYGKHIFRLFSSYAMMTTARIPRGIYFRFYTTTERRARQRLCNRYYNISESPHRTANARSPQFCYTTCINERRVLLRFFFNKHNLLYGFYARARAGIRIVRIMKTDDDATILDWRARLYIIILL